MPGVPTGKACDQCRKVKKKCDERKPKCSRCIRLDLECIGSGQQRYKFKQHETTPPSDDGTSNGRALVQSSALRKRDGVVVDVVPLPGNKLSFLLGSLVEAMKPSTDVRFNIAFSYGGFLEDVPQHLGMNEALDASVEALVSAHSDISSRRTDISTRTLRSYSDALQALRRCLDDPLKATTAETICAVLVLMICQATGHCEGAIHILRARGHIKPRNNFEKRVLSSLRGPVLFTALFSSKVKLSQQEWKSLIENDMDEGNSLESRLIRCLSHIPNLMLRGWLVRNGELVDPQLSIEKRIQYQNMQSVVAQMHQRTTEFEAAQQQEGEYNIKPKNSKYLKIPPELLPWVRARNDRSHGLSLMIAIILNCMLSANNAVTIANIIANANNSNNLFDSNNQQIQTQIQAETQMVLQNLYKEQNTLQSEATSYARTIINLSHNAHRYRPLGAGWVSMCLTAAYAVTTPSPSQIPGLGPGLKPLTNNSIIHDTQLNTYQSSHAENQITSEIATREEIKKDEVLDILHSFQPDFGWSRDYLNEECLEGVRMWLKGYDQ